MRPRCVTGEHEAFGALVDKDVARGACDWSDDKPLEIRGKMNRASEAVTLIMCEKARSDLIERRIAMAQIPLKDIPILDVRNNSVRDEQTALNAAFFKGESGGDAAIFDKAPPKWVELERAASRSNFPLRAANGAVLASVWLEHPNVASRRNPPAALLRLKRKRDKEALRRNALRKRTFGLLVFGGLVAHIAVDTRVFLSAFNIIYLSCSFLVVVMYRSPLFLCCTSMVLLPLFAFAPELLGKLFSVCISHYAVARGSNSVHVPKVEAQSIAMHAWFVKRERVNMFLEKESLSWLLDLVHDLLGPKVIHWYGGFRWSLYVSVVIRGFKFGNPPGFRKNHM